LVEYIKNILVLIRIKHWIKNLFVFFPAFFAGKIEQILDVNLFLVFISFCFAASSIYIVNDIIDVEKDRNHPIKRNRPIASGFLSIRFSIILLIFLIITLAITLTLIKHALFYILFYFILNIFYSFWLKNISILDVVCISVGFVLRIMGGGAATDIYISHWMIIMVFLLTISIAFSKRRDDLVLNIEKGAVRKSLSGYTIQFLDIAKSISFSITLIAYILYSISIEVTERLGTDKMYITSLFVFCGIMRYIQISVVDKNAGSPVDLLMKDRFIQITLLSWIIALSIIIYGKQFDL